MHEKNLETRGKGVRMKKKKHTTLWMGISLKKIIKKIEFNLSRFIIFVELETWKKRDLGGVKSTWICRN